MGRFIIGLGFGLGLIIKSWDSDRKDDTVERNIGGGMGW